MKPTALLFLLGLFVAIAVRADEPCPSVRFKHPISLSENEHRLVCGDAKSAEWKRVPPAEAERYLTTFLQSRGYHNPKMDESGGVLVVDPGKQSTLKTIYWDEESDRSLDFNKLRNAVGKPLTPELLDYIEKWVMAEYKRRGYACPVVKSVSDPIKETVRVLVRPGAHTKIISVDANTIPGVTPGALRRYDPFEVGDPYDIDLLELSKSRILGDELVEATFFQEECTAEGVKLHQELIARGPQLLKFGFGFNTEQLFLFRAGYKHARLGLSASSFSTDIALSFREQTLNILNDWRYWEKHPRRHLRTQITLSRLDEVYTESILAKLSAMPTFEGDAAGMKWLVAAGPAASYSTTLRGPGPQDQWMGTLEADATFTEHHFELYQQSPRRGYRWTTSASVAERGVLSPISAQRISLLAQNYWNIGHYDPPFLVFGMRTGIATTHADAATISAGAVPTHFRHFLGGAANLRGFGRKELPGPNGALVAAYLSLELRLSDVLPWKLQPFTFVDGGFTGTDFLAFNSQLYWSPGIGIRWESPIGSIRATASHGFEGNFVASALSHWQFYFTLGEEF